MENHEATLNTLNGNRTPAVQPFALSTTHTWTGKWALLWPRLWQSCSKAISWSKYWATSRWW